MKPYADAAQQLVVEIYTRNIEKSRDFYESFGFDVIRDEGDFIEMKWEEKTLLLEQVKDAETASVPSASVRVMVPNVDDYFARAQKLGVRILRPLADRYYGLRDFTMATPDGIALRFATRLSDAKK
jgi:catechol 2,3-dioxygenase-like lactoylglutathione lyase family enzyme